jgi:hypothetical protein
MGIALKKTLANMNYHPHASTYQVVTKCITYLPNSIVTTYIPYLFIYLWYLPAHIGN